MGLPTGSGSAAPGARDRGRLVVVALAALALATLAGCQPPLFTSRDVRSPYDRYDIVRDRYPQPFLRDEFGRKLPNLRGRLLRGP